MATDEHEPTRSPSDTSEDAPTLDSSDSGAAAGAPLPSAIGGYRVLGRLGAGSMGIVFEAEQESPRRRVALKVIRGGSMADEARVRMFQREAASLARLRHPNIAAIYEAGRTPEGEEWIAMELVRGRNLDAYLRARPAPAGRDELRFRVRLLIALAEAVHYAHQRGVIHRDLKPSNVVAGEAEGAGAQALPDFKILDFGLARIAEADLDAATAFTEVGVIKGTLRYMSPEQARGEGDAIDVRTDVYTLGVMLFEVLTGLRPYELPRGSVAEAVRIICEQPPLSLAKAWGATRPADADLQTILGKALEKDAERRYSSAQALADDLQRWLDARPILARAPSTAYQLKKFAERNRVLVAGAAATLLALLLGLAGTTAFGLREQAARRAAEQARQDTQTVVEFQAAMLSAVDAQLMGRRLVDDFAARLGAARREIGADSGAAAAGLRAQLAAVNATDAALRVIDEDILQRALATADTQFAARPRIRVQLLTSIANTYLRLGLIEQALPPYTAARALWDSLAGPDARETLEATRQLAGVYVAVSDVEHGLPLLRQVLAGQQRTLGPTHRDALATLNDLGVLLTDAGELAEAESLYAFAAPAQMREFGPNDPATLAFQHNWAWTLTQAHEFARAESLTQIALAGRRRVLGEHHNETMQSLNNLAVIYRMTDRTDKAEPLIREDYEVSRAQLGDEHPETLVSMCNLGRALNAQKKFAESEPFMARCLALSRKVLPPGHIGISIALLAHGEALIGAHRPAAAERELLEAHGVLHEQRGPADSGVRRAAGMLAEVYEQTGRMAQAAEWRKRAEAPAEPAAAR